MRTPRVLRRRRVGLFVRLVANGFMQAAATVATAFLVEHHFNRILSSSGRIPVRHLLLAGGGLLGAASASALLRMKERTDAERMGQDYAVDVRMTLYKRLVSLSPRALQGRSHGGVMLRFVGDLRALQQWVSLGLARLLVGSVTTIAALVALSLLNTRLSLAVGGVLAIGAAAAVSLGGRLRAATLEARLHRGRLAANMGEKVASLAVVQLYGQPERERRRVNRDSRRLQHAMVRRARVAGLLRAITEGTGAAATAVALLVGAHEVGSGRATPGTVVASMAVVGLLHSPLRDMSRVQEYWQYSRVAHRKIRQFLLIPSLVTEKKGAPELVASQGQLEFDAVELSGALDHVTACAGPGSRVALVGPNGAGKSTLLALAARLIDPDSGVVKVDGQDLKEHSLGSVRRAIGIVGPDLPLLRGTVDKNLKYRWPDAPEDEIAEVKALCGIDEVLAELPEGGATRISEGGVGLSAGQRQRISLARALLGRPSVLLLDEVDTHLDPRAGEVVDRVLTQFKGTVVMVTHRPDRLRGVDAIWHLQSGRLVEQGAPGGLALSDGPTSRLFGLSSTAAGPKDETA